jgi:hypothetical protein
MCRVTPTCSVSLPANLARSWLAATGASWRPSRVGARRLRPQKPPPCCPEGARHLNPGVSCVIIRLCPAEASDFRGVAVEGWSVVASRLDCSSAMRYSVPPSSSGLGHRPFKATAGIRIPVGAPRLLSAGHRRSARPGRIAQWESTCLTSRGSQVQILLRPLELGRLCSRRERPLAERETKPRGREIIAPFAGV